MCDRAGTAPGRRPTIGGWIPRLLAAWLAISPAGSQAAELSGEAVLARVGGQPITEAEFQYELARVLGNREWDPRTRERLRGETLEQLILRRLVTRHLQQAGLAASGQEVDLVLQRELQAAEARGVTTEEFLASIGLSREAYRRRLAWQIGWQRFLDRHLTDENRRRYFQQHRAEFDGTQVQVAQILLRVESPEDPAAVASAVKRAGELRERIVSGELSFAEAARRFSQAPTAEAGGEMGAIQRRHPMPEAFSRAAFALEEGQISRPVVSRFGVHLIRRGPARPGDKGWDDVRPELDRAMARHLFQWAADQARGTAVVERLSGEAASVGD